MSCRRTACSSPRRSRPGNYDLTVYRNGERLFTRNIKVRCLFSLGCFKAGDTVTLTYPVAEGKEGTISLDVAEQNDAVFDAGLSRLSRSVWNVTEDTDTRLSGTVDAAEDGLFYTSIPYENGWRSLWWTALKSRWRRRPAPCPRASG